MEREITDLSEIKNIELEILKYTTNFCEKNNLKYILGYGTLLGAVRHKGFIPWDDDIDILMPRKDYDKLCKIWGKSNRYKLLDCRNDKEYIYPFVKIIDSYTRLKEYDTLVQTNLGIYIDIFPYDGVPEDESRRRKLLKKCANLEKMRMHSMMSVEKIMHSDPKKNIGRKMLWKVLNRIGPARLSRIIEKTIAKYSVSNSKWQGCLCTRFPEREIMSYKVWKGTTELEFEGQEFKVPLNYDEMLKINYGDYMKLPPEEERCLKHNFKAWEIL